MRLTIVVGAARCGATLLSRLLRDHPEVISAGAFTPYPPGRVVLAHLAPASLHRLTDLRAAFPSAFVIHLHRDGPDSALAMGGSLQAAGAVWSSAILRITEALAEVPHHLHTTLRYEDLRHHPEAELTRLAAHLGLTVDGDWLGRARAAVDPSRGAADLSPETRARLEEACAPGAAALA